MKLSQLHEMTLRANDLSYNLSRYFTAAVKKIKSFTHVGDIEDQFQVLQEREQFLIVSQDQPVAYFYIELKEERPEVAMAFVVEEFRRQNIFAKFIWFLKRFFNSAEILIGDVHSKDTVEALKKLSTRFDISWEKDGSRVKYDVNSIDDFYSVSKSTGWKIVLENDGDFSAWPKFFDINKPNIKQHYDWLLED